MFSEKAGNEWKRSQIRRKGGRGQLTNRDSKKSSQIKRKRSTRELNRKGHIKLDLKSKLTNQRGNTSRNMSVKKRGNLTRTINKSSVKCFFKRKSNDKSKKIRMGLANSKREIKKESKKKHGLMGMLKDKVKRSQKSLSRIARNYKSKIKIEGSQVKKKNRRNPSKEKAKTSFKMKENRSNWQIKLKKKKFRPEKIEKVIRAFDERCKRIDRKLGVSKQSKQGSIDIGRKESIKKKRSIRSKIKNSKKKDKESGCYQLLDKDNEGLKSGRLGIKGLSSRRVKEETKNSGNSEYMLRQVKIKNKNSLESLGFSRQSSRQQFSIRKTFKDNSQSENEMANLLNTNQKDKGSLHKSGKSTLGLWSSSIKNIHKNQIKFNISKQIKSTTAKDKKKESKEIKKFLSPERIKSYLLREKPKKKFGDEQSQNFFLKYKRGGSKSNLDSKLEKSKSRLLTGDKTPSSHKNKAVFDSIKNSSGGNRKMNNEDQKWDLQILEMESLLDALQQIGAMVSVQYSNGISMIRELLGKIELFLNLFIGKQSITINIFKIRFS
jgi:hypothetical protein